MDALTGACNEIVSLANEIKKLREENELLTKVAEKAKDYMYILKCEDEEEGMNASSIMDDNPPRKNLDQALSAWRKWKEKK